jgi:hypothetical protein
MLLVRERPPRSRPPPLGAFLALSILAHVGTFAAARWGRPQASLPMFEPPEQAVTLAGDTLDVEPATSPAPAAPEDTPEDAPTPAAAPALAHAVAHAPASASASTHAPTPAPPPPLFGAVGARLATDLATAFTRALPQVASADPAWSSAGLGSTSSATVTLVLDDDGHLAQRSLAGAPSDALRRGIERTLVLLGAREFTARAASTRLRITARVSRDDVHDGLHGDVFALSGGSFAGDIGMAFFALPGRAGPGRRVDVELRLLP